MFYLLICSNCQLLVDVEEKPKGEVPREWIIRTNDLNTAKLIAQRNDLVVDESYFQYYQGHFLLKEQISELSNKKLIKTREIEQITTLLQNDQDVSFVFEPQYSSIQLLNKRNLPTSGDPIFFQQYHIYQLNVPIVWDQYNITGRGITVVINDAGLEITHPDLKNNYDPSLSKDYYGNPLNSTEIHSTPIAGIIAAENNNICGIGIAFNSKVSIRRLFNPSPTLAMVFDALTYLSNTTLISSNSYGTDGTLFYNSAFSYEFSKLFEETIKVGRNGLGTIYVYAAGNERRTQGNTNYNIQQTIPQVIAVASITPNYVYSDFSSPGYSILCTAGGSFIQTTDRTGTDGYTKTDCADGTDAIRGTSFSTPAISAVVALMLEANPKLNWQEVQSVLIESSKKIDYTNPSWIVNAAGYKYSPDYGFGLPDAEKVVVLAKEWTSTTLKPSFRVSNAENVTIPQSGSPNALTNSSIFIHQRTIVHRARIFLSIQHPQLTDLEISLTSPSGTKSVFAKERGQYLGVGISIKDANNTTINGLLPVGDSGLTNYDIEAPLLYADSFDLCSPFTNPLFVGKIVLLGSGNCNIYSKVANAQNAGAVAALTLGTQLASTPSITFPTVAIRNSDGINLRDRLLLGESLTGRLFKNMTKAFQPVNTLMVNFSMSTFATYGEKSHGKWVLSVEDKFNDIVAPSSISPVLMNWTLEIFPFENVMSDQYVDDNYHEDNHNNHGNYHNEDNHHDHANEGNNHNNHDNYHNEDNHHDHANEGNNNNNHDNYHNEHNHNNDNYHNEHNHNNHEEFNQENDYNRQPIQKTKKHTLGKNKF